MWASVGSPLWHLVGPGRTRSTHLANVLRVLAHARLVVTVPHGVGERLGQELGSEHTHTTHSADIGPELVGVEPGVSGGVAGAYLGRGEAVRSGGERAPPGRDMGGVESGEGGWEVRVSMWERRARE